MEALSASDVVYCGTGSQIHQRNVVRIYRKFCLLLPMLLSVGHPSFTSCLSSTMAGHAFLSTILLLPILSYCAFRMLFKYLDYRVRHTWHLILLRFNVKPLGLCWRTGRHRTVSHSGLILQRPTKLSANNMGVNRLIDYSMSSLWALTVCIKSFQRTPIIGSWLSSCIIFAFGVIPSNRSSLALEH